MRVQRDAQFVLCVRDGGYPASLEIRKVYQVLPDTEAGGHGLIRIVDESGEDYLYPEDLFVPIELPTAAEPAFSGSS
ncbi:MAG: hypothetical protein M3542_07625 [Acidobacteriota bacterium]|nr:hypothetical protein [Acidobacteriota bacterium]MDQ5871200.1 hypothetical protein [Acidobacteriota bacterium]